MKRMILALGMVAAMLVTASSAMAAGINMRWDNCFGDAGVSDKAFACNVNTGSNTMVGSFVLDNNITLVTGIEVVIDLIVANGQTVPDWWLYNAPGGATGCRTTGLTVNPTISGSAVNCIDWAQGGAAGGLAAYSNELGSISPTVSASHKRIKIGFAVAPPGIDVVAAQEYFAFNILLNHSKTVGTGSCVGCTLPVCLVLNSILVQPGTNPGTKLGTGTVAGSNFCTWQGGAGADCQAVPTKNSTWGQVKSLYH